MVKRYTVYLMFMAVIIKYAFKPMEMKMVGTVCAAYLRMVKMVVVLNICLSSAYPTS